MTSPAARRIILCADDYGISPGVNRAIRELMATRRINATSVMTVAGAFDRTETDALAKAATEGKGAIGLHLTMTAPFSPLTMHFRPLRDNAFLPQNAMLRAGFAGRLDREILRSEIEAQIAAFAAAFGRPPDFVDGHQHVHLYPTVRDALVAAVASAAPKAWVRQCRRLGPLSQRLDGAKALFLDWLSTGLIRRAGKAGVRVNPGFSGAYDFDRPADFPALFVRFLADVPDGGVIMCHPGFVDDELTRVDRFTTVREREHAYFASEEHPRRLAAANVTLL